MKTTLQRVLLFVAMIAVLGGLTRFAFLRFQSGDVYPPYSTYRTDPLGAKALFESLKRVRPEAVQRNVHPLEHIERGERKSSTTVVLLGVAPFQTEQEETLLRDFANAGGRVVIALDARDSRERKVFNRTVPTVKPPGKGSTNVVVMAQTNFHTLFGLDVSSTGLKEGARQDATREIDEPMLPETMSWFGHYAFSGVTNGNWEVVYSLNQRPVVIRQKAGLGTILLLADSYPFSNEAMRAARTPEFLLWALDSLHVMFDETHLGLVGGAGVAVMMREFRLQGLIAGCLLLAALWIWRNAAPLVPPPAASEAGEQAMEGKTARQAIIHLLRKNIGGADALRVGVEEWAKANPPHFHWETVRLEEAKRIVAHIAKSRQPEALAAAHQQLSELLFPKKH